jgi:hypothetical protein
MFDTCQDGWRPEMALRVGDRRQADMDAGLRRLRGWLFPGMREMDAANSP